MSAIGGQETNKQIVLQHERYHNRGMNVWWETGLYYLEQVSPKGRYQEDRKTFQAEGTACVQV